MGILEKIFLEDKDRDGDQEINQEINQENIKVKMKTFKIKKQI